MTKEEFKHIYGQFFPSGDPTRFVDYVFNVFDIDKNGVITFKEFILAISITTRGTIEEKLNWAFSLYDFDSDGYVSREEMLDIVRAIYRMHGKEGEPEEKTAAHQRVDELFTKLDTDQDGKLSREEFCKGFKNDAWIIKALLLKSPLASTSTTSLLIPESETSPKKSSSTSCTASVGNGLH
ncbi:neuronal calcium sensor 1 isoform X2 [Parasteatoda tepidariorum]|nr:neuronal calcium sensor 1 isoform X2 [Parasteatoda tepidariorum]